MRHDGFEEFVPRAFGLGGVEHPQAVAAGVEQACLGEYLEVPRDTRLPHAQQRDQLVHRKFVMEKHQSQPKPRFVRQCLEVAKCFHVFSE